MFFGREAEFDLTGTNRDRNRPAPQAGADQT